MSRWQLRGRVAGGRRLGAAFTMLPWARQGFMDLLGIAPHPGTLNLRLDEASERDAWLAVRDGSGQRLRAPDPSQCDALCYPVRIDDRYPAALVRPLLADYPADQLELVAAIELRPALGIADGDRLTISCRPQLPVRAVVFDVDGTLVNSLDGYCAAAALAAAPFGLTVTRDLVARALNGNRSFWDLAVPAELQSADFTTTLRRETMRHWPQVLRESVRCFEGLPATLDALRARGLRLAICTGSRGESFRPLTEAGLFEYFETVVTADDVGRRKPHPDGLLRCLDDLGVAAAEAAYVGDTVPDIEAARAAGMLAVGVLSGAASSAELTAAGADRLAASHRDLLSLGFTVPTGA